MSRTRAMLLSIFCCWQSYIFSTVCSFWIPVGDTFQKAYLEEWQRVDDGSIRDPSENSENSMRTVPCVADSMRQRRAENSDCSIKYEQLLDTSSTTRSSWQAVGEPDAPAWKLSQTQVLLWPLGRNWRHHCFSRNACAILFTSYPYEEILSGYEEDFTFKRDGFYYVDENDRWLTFDRPSQNIVRPLCEGKRHLFKNISTTAACQTAHPFRRG